MKTNVLTIICLLFGLHQTYATPIKIGGLFSLTGNLEINGPFPAQATQFAIDELNAAGGVLGKKVELIIKDYKSDAALARQNAQELLEQENVVALFGLWLSSTRRELEPLLAQKNTLLFFPTITEGLDETKNVIFGGPAPNQAIIPAFTWSYYHLGKTFFLVGSNDIFSYATEKIIEYQAQMLGAKIVGSEHIPLGSQDVSAVINKISDLKPSVIINTIDGSTNKAFFEQLKAKGITSDKTPVISTTIGETEIKQYGINNFVGHYCVANYFQTLDKDSNYKFINRYKKKYGQDQLICNGMITAYNNVYLWAKAVERAGTTDIDPVRAALAQMSFNGPGGTIYLDNHYTWSSIYIGKIRFDGQINILWDSQGTIAPTIYPPYQSKEEWQKFLNTLYTQWGNKWYQ